MPTRHHILPVIFLAVIGTPLCVQLTGRVAGGADNEKRALAALPARPATWTDARAFPKKFATYYGDHFGLRPSLIRLHALATYRLAGASPTDKVILGKEGWLYYADDYSLEDYRSATPFRPEELERWQTILQERHDWLARRGTKLVTVLACDKYVIYPEYLPDGLRRANQPYRVDVLADYLRQHTQLNVVALHDPLIAAKNAARLYHRTDTHWNDRGAYIGYREILQAAGIEPLPPTAFTPGEATTPGWDLARMMGLDDVISEEDCRLDPRTKRQARIVEQDRPDAQWNQGRVVLERDDPSLPTAVIFRDSFGSALVPFLAEHFRRSVFLWQYDLDTEVIEQENPSVVIWLMTSRRLQWYIPTNPPFPDKSTEVRR
jgi:alginate O-acetyltransferase complex protein AlgJ